MAHGVFFSFVFVFFIHLVYIHDVYKVTKLPLLLFKVIFEMFASKNTQQLKLSLCPQSNLTKSMLNFFASFLFLFFFASLLF